MSNRQGARNPFFGRNHTDEWKHSASERQTTWTSEELVTLRQWYVEREGQPLKLDELAALLGRPKTSVCRMASACGLTHRARPTGRKPRAKHPDEATRLAAIGEASRERIARNGHPRGMLGKKQKPEVLARAREGADRWRANATPEERDAVVDRTQQTLMERYGTLAPGNDAEANPYARSKYGRRADLGGQFFRSSWEANYARFLNFLLAQGQIAGWEYETVTFWFEAIRRGVRSYKPDFKVTESDGSVYFVEVKGWMDDKSRTKLARMAKYYPDVDLRVVGESAYREIARKVGSGLPGWE